MTTAKEWFFKNFDGAGFSLLILLILFIIGIPITALTIDNRTHLEKMSCISKSGSWLDNKCIFLTCLKN